MGNSRGAERVKMCFKILELCCGTAELSDTLITDCRFEWQRYRKKPPSLDVGSVLMEVRWTHVYSKRVFLAFPPPLLAPAEPTDMLVFITPTVPSESGRLSFCWSLCSTAAT